jgi:hypothetical protein
MIAVRFNAWFWQSLRVAVDFEPAFTIEFLTFAGLANSVLGLRPKGEPSFLAVRQFAVISAKSSL